MAHAKFKFSSEFKTLEIQFDNIKPIASAKVLGKRTSVSKVIKQVVSENYTSSLSPQDVVAFYSKQLQTQGWRIKSAASPTSQTFCMDDLDATIEILNPSSGKFNFEVRWEGVTAVKTGC